MKISDCKCSNFDEAERVLRGKNYILSLEFVMIIQLFYPDGQHHRLWLSAAILLTQRESALDADSFLTSLAGFSEFPSPQCTRSTHVCVGVVHTCFLKGVLDQCHVGA